MAITGRFISGQIGITPSGVTLTAGIDLIDDKLGQVGHQALSPQHEVIETQVRQFIEQSLPLLSAMAGYEILMPAPPETISIEVMDSHEETHTLDTKTNSSRA